MGNLHNELGQRLVRAGLHSVTSSGRSLSRGRACSPAPQWAHSSLRAWSPSSETSRWECTTAPQWQGAALCKPATPHPQAPCKAKSIFTLPQGAKGRPPPTHQLDTSTVKPPASSNSGRLPWEGTLDSHIGDNSSSIRPHHKEVQCNPRPPLGDPPAMFCQAHHTFSIEVSVSPLFQPRNLRGRSSPIQEPDVKAGAGWLPKCRGSGSGMTIACWLGQLPWVAWGYHWQLRWCSEYPQGYKPSYATWEDCAKEEG